MCMGGGGSPSPPPLPPEPAPPPTMLDPQVVRNKATNRRRAALASGRDSTILTGPQGLSPETGTLKTVLGS